MSDNNDGAGLLRLSDAEGTDPKGNVAFRSAEVEDKIVQQYLTEQADGTRELAKKVADLEKLIEKKKELEAQAEQSSKDGKKDKKGKTRHIANAEDWKAVCTAPDLCRVGRDIVAFNSYATLKQKQTASPDVKARGTAVYRKDDVIQNVQADAGKHVVSHTSLNTGYVKILDGHDNVKVNNIPVARHDSRCLINCDASGAGGAQGKLVTEQKSAASKSAAASNPQAPPGERSSEKLKALKRAREKVSSGMIDFNAPDEYIRFNETNQILDDLIGQIRAKPGTALDYGAQVTRGVLGFGKDIVMGISEVAYEGAKAIPKLIQRNETDSGKMLTALDGQILAENIRLGNITPGLAWQGALNIGKAIVKPVTDPWEKGQYVASVTRGIAEVASAGLGWIKVGKAGKAAEVAAEAAKAAELAEAAKKAEALEAAKAGDDAAAHVDDGVHVKAEENPKLHGGNSTVPHGFANADEFSQFGNDMRVGLGRAGYENAEPLLQGSAVTGKSFKTGQPFDVGRVSDFDVALADPALLGKADELGIGLRSGGTRTGPLTARDLRKLGLRDLSSQMGQQTGRDVNFMIYNNSATAVQRAPSVILPGRK